MLSEGFCAFDTLPAFLTLAFLPCDTRDTCGTRLTRLLGIFLDFIAIQNESRGYEDGDNDFKLGVWVPCSS